MKASAAGAALVLAAAALACSPGAAPAPGAAWNEPVLGMAFRYAPPGTFTMGSRDDEPGRDEDEVQHEVTLTGGFWIGETEVTQGQWRALLGGNPALLAGCGEDCPVERVSWFEAVAFADRLSQRAGLQSCYVLEGCRGTLGGGCPATAQSPGDWCLGDFACQSVTFRGLDCPGFRLPTEAEWEHAARAGTTTAIYTGGLTLRALNDGPELDAVAWYGGNSGAAYEGAWDCSGWQHQQFPAEHCGTHPVGRKRANPWGLHDVLGNVWEWVWDWKDAYPEGAVINPLGPAAGAYRVRRGCAWSNIPDHCRAADRSDDDPHVRDRNWGFRLARTATPGG